MARGENRPKGRYRKISYAHYFQGAGFAVVFGRTEEHTRKWADESLLAKAPGNGLLAWIPQWVEYIAGRHSKRQPKAKVPGTPRQRVR